MEKNKVFDSLEQVKSYANDHNRILVVFDDYVLDATTFAKHHPGGAGLIMNYQSKNITNEMKVHFPLSLTMANSMVVGTFERQIKRMINPDKPLLPQVWNMDNQTYMKIVNSPHWLFTESPRMFQSDLFEFFSHNKWYSIILIPFIVCCYNILNTTWTNVNYPLLIVTLFLGIFSFTLVEYLLHRFIFHSERYLPDSKLVRYVHFLLHGVHHMLPVDPDRLVYPPALAVITIFIGYWTVGQILVFRNPQVATIFWMGFFSGYLMYDMTHYFLHHIDTSKTKGSYFNKLQRYHNQHHYGGEELGFGVSSKFWDIVFRTEMTKKAQH